MKLNKTAFAILALFNKSMSHYNKTYCWPTRAKIQKQLSDWFGISVSLSWLDDNLGILKSSGYILSFQNWGTRGDGTHFNKPSNRQLTSKAVKLLMCHGVRVARRVFQKISAPWYAKRKKAAGSQNTTPDPESEKTTRSKNPFKRAGPRGVGSTATPLLEPV